MRLASEILARIQPLSDAQHFSAASQFLSDSAVRYHEGSGIQRVSGEAVYHGYSRRLKNLRRKGMPPIAGLEALVEALEDLPPSTTLESHIFEGERGLAVFFFDQESGAPVGFIVGKPNPRSHSTYEFAMGRDD